MPKDTASTTSPVPDLSVVIPCFNEQARVALLAAGVDALLAASPELLVEVVLVDDGSTDKTLSLLAEYAGRLEAGHPDRVRAHVVALARNRGKGRALQAGVARTTGRRILTADTDMATPLVQLLDWHDRDLVDLDSAKIYIGSREHPQSVIEDASSRRLMGRIFNLLVQLVVGLPLRDSQCGFKLYPGDPGRRLFADLRVHDWSHDVELLAAARDDSIEIVSLPVRWRAVADSRVRPLRDALAMAVGVLRIRASLFLRRRVGLGAGRACADIWFDRVTLLLLGVAGVVVLSTFRHYGITWDEELHRRYGELVFRFYATLGSAHHDRGALGLANLYLYGGLFDAAGYLASRVLPFSAFESRHLLNALVGLGGVVGTARLARHLWGSRAAVLATAILLLTPTYYGHLFANPKDVPFAAAFVWALYYIVRAIDEAPRVSRGVAIKCAASIGVTLGLRVGGLLLLCYLALVLVVGWSRHWLRRGRLDRSVLAATVWRFGAIALGSWIVMLLLWPYAFEQPLEGPINAFRAFAAFPFHGSMLYGGRVLSFPGDATPLDYVPRLLALQLPVMWSLLAALSLGILAVAVWRCRDIDALASQGRLAFVWFVLLFPVAHVLVTRAVLYDNLRHLTFLLPLIALLAAHGAEAVFRTVSRRAATWVVAMALAVYCSSVVGTMVRLHPYEYVYYNRIVGGLAGAAGKYESDYWAAAYREAALDLVRWKAEQDPEGAPLRVHVTGPSWAAIPYFDAGLTPVGGLRSADVVLTTTRTGMQQQFDAPVLLCVERYGVPLAVVFDLRGAVR